MLLLFLDLVSIQILLHFKMEVLHFLLSLTRALIISLAVLNLAFSLSVLGFLIMHASLVTANTTTIEVIVFFIFKLS